MTFRPQSSGIRLGANAPLLLRLWAGRSASDTPQHGNYWLWIAASSEGQLPTQSRRTRRTGIGQKRKLIRFSSLSALQRLWSVVKRAALRRSRIPALDRRRSPRGKGERLECED